MTHDDDLPPNWRDSTRLVNAGRNPAASQGFVNPPVYHASTVVYPTAEALIHEHGAYHYGRFGTPTSDALEAALRALEGPACAGVALAPSGLSAITLAMMAALKAGDHMLVMDSVYRPTRVAADTVMARFGVAVTYFDPLAGAAVEALFNDRTRAVFLEAPGSQSFEMPDIPLIASIARRRGAIVLMDNTWATPLFFRPLDHGVDLAIQSGTKYIGGHSDLMIGAVAANAATWPALYTMARATGLCVGPDDMNLALRGLRSLEVRLKQHEKNARRLSAWFADRPEVARVLDPALPGDPGHALWRRDFKGASGLFSLILKPVPDKAVHAFLDALRLFGLGYSWGGYESLVIPFDCASYRTATQWKPGGPGLRFHIGLEDPEDLIADLEAGFAALNASR